MRRIGIALLVSAAVVWLALWWTGSFEDVARFAAAQQRSFQNTIAGALRAARAGDAGAVTALLTACFAYGFFHAIGPGHGKILIGGYGVGRHVPMLRLTTISLVASLGQALTAIVLVYAGVTFLSLGRERMISVTEGLMAPISYGAIVLIGTWLVWRGLRRMRPMPHNHDHQHDGHGTCVTCGHAHGPTLSQVEQTGTLREALVLIGGIAIRPCTGALFVLVITWQMGIGLLGIWGAVAMAMGTATVTVATGIGAVFLRGRVVSVLAGSARTVQIMAMIEVVAGAAVVALAGGLLFRAL
jgi:ABC-type nickel/cobalt efflux system permease component RcnA